MWVTKPEYYAEFDESGQLLVWDEEERIVPHDPAHPNRPFVERIMLDPRASPGVQGWWTCHRDTQPGDLVLLYRTSPMKDVAYLLEAATPAFSLPAVDVPSATWQWGCDFRVIELFAETLPWDRIKSDEVLSEWGVTRAGPRRQVFAMPERFFNRCIALLDDLNPGTSATIPAWSLPKEQRDELWVESTLADRIGLLGALGYRIAAHRRQVVCQHIGGRIDVLCETNDGAWLVVELKAVVAKPAALTQTAQYVAWVRDHLASAGQRVTGLLIAPDFDPKTRAAVTEMPNVSLGVWSEQDGGLALRSAE